MLVSSAKQKGRKLQQWTRDAILAAFPALEPDDAKSTSSGANGEDIQLSPAARKVFPFTVECKARKSFKTLYDFYDQAVSQGKGEPLVILKQDRRAPLVLLDAAYFIKRVSQ